MSGQSERMTEAKAREIVAVFERNTCPTPDGGRMHCSERDHHPELHEFLSRPEFREFSEVSLFAKASGYLARLEQENADLTRFREAHKESTERNLELHFQLQEKQREIEKLRDLNRRAKDVLVMNQECEQVASVGWNRERIKRKELEVALTAERERSGEYRAQLEATVTHLRARWADGKTPLAWLVKQIEESLTENPTGGNQG